MNIFKVLEVGIVTGLFVVLINNLIDFYREDYDYYSDDEVIHKVR